MTTQMPRPLLGAGALVATGGVALVCGLVGGGLSAALTSAHYLPGALAAAGVTAVFVLGTLLVNAVAALAPQLSLLFAMLTLTLQLLAAAALLVALASSDLVTSAGARRSMGIAALSVALAWTVGLVVGTLRATPAQVPVEGGSEALETRSDQGFRGMGLEP